MVCISSNLTFVCPCIANVFPKWNQQNATFRDLFISTKCSTCFRRFLRPSSGAHNCTYSCRYCQPIQLLAAASSCIGWQYLTLHVRFCAPDDGRRNRLKHVEHFVEINKSRNVAYCWLYFGKKYISSTYLVVRHTPSDYEYKKQSTSSISRYT